MRAEVAEKEETSFSGFKFFTPSEELTKALMKKNQQLVSEYVERNFPPGYQHRETESEATDGSLLGRLGLGKSLSARPIDTVRQTEMGQRLISERLYNYLSSLAETPLGLEGNSFHLWKYIPVGMATMLGLSAYRDMPTDSAQAIEIRQLLERISLEFRNWLLEEQQGVFMTPWIEIHLNHDDDLRLISLEEVPITEPQLASEPEVDQLYFGTVTKVTDYGAFVEIFPGTEGLLHISEIADHRINDVRDELKEGQQIRVKCVGIDGNKIKLSRKAALRDFEISPRNSTTGVVNGRLVQRAASED